jgi:putative PIN family toxin of toxin-antitoxin system
MVFVQALANAKGPAHACYQLVQSGMLCLHITPAVVAEVREVLGRSKLRKKLPSLTPEVVDAFLRDVESHAVLLSEVSDVFKFPRDPKDEPYLNLAIAAQARYLVSRDNDLLDLMEDEGFRRQYPGLTIIDPGALLRELTPSPKLAAEPAPGEGDRQG